MALFRYQKRLSAKKYGYDVLRGLTFAKTSPQCPFVGNEGT